MGLTQKILYLVSKEEDEGGYGKERKYLRRKIFGQQRKKKKENDENLLETRERKKLERHERQKT